MWRRRVDLDRRTDFDTCRNGNTGTINLFDLPRGTDEIDLLNDAGEGWELVAIAANNVAYLKRQIARPVTPSARSPSQGT
jgi:hypothetical protein